MNNFSKTIIPELSGIYIITNVVNGKCYIGSSVNVYLRLMQHKSELLAGKHVNRHLQNSFNKHCIDNFKVEILEFCDRDALLEKENSYLSEYSNKYNIRVVADDNRGLSPSVESNIKRSNTLKGRRPKNLLDIQKVRRRKLAEYLNGTLLKVHESCAEAARAYGIKPNVLHEYIGRDRKTNLFPTGTKFEYYDPSGL